MDLNNSYLISNLMNENRKLEIEINKLREEKKCFKKKLNMLNIKKYRKPFFSSSNTSKSRLRKDIKKIIIELNKKLILANLTVRKIKLVEDKNNYENSCDLIEIVPSESEISTEKML